MRNVNDAFGFSSGNLVYGVSTCLPDGTGAGWVLLTGEDLLFGVGRAVGRLGNALVFGSVEEE